MKDPVILEQAKSQIGAWIGDLTVLGEQVSTGMKQELLAQLQAASAVAGRDGTLEIVLPGLSALGLGIFKCSFRLASRQVRVVPYATLS